MIKSVNRSDIARRLAKELGLTIKQTEDIFVEAEDAIQNFLLERGQVRIHQFGTFYRTTIKSHVIKQIRTKTPRIVLEQKSVKFRPSPIFKDAIYQRVRKKRIFPEKDETQIEIKRMPQGNIAVKYQPTVKKPPAKVDLPPLSRWQRVDPKLMQHKIKERWLSVAKSHREEVPKAIIAREAQIFARLLFQIRKAKIGSVDFSYERERDVKIFCGRPRRQVSHLPREIVKGFLTYLDLIEFHIPQERHKLIFINEPGYDKINVRVHSFPTHQGASIHIEIK